MKVDVTDPTTFRVGVLRREIRRGLILRMTNNNAQKYDISCEDSKNLLDGMLISNLPFDKTNSINLCIGPRDDFAIGMYLKKTALVILQGQGNLWFVFLWFEEFQYVFFGSIELGIHYMDVYVCYTASYYGMPLTYDFFYHADEGVSGTPER